MSSTPKKATAKKAAAKKTVARKSAVKKTAKKAAKKTATKKTKNTPPPLTVAKSGETFWTTNGEIIATLLELKEALGRMPEEVFSYHVTKDKNDFAQWVETVLQDKECAAALRRARKKSSAHTVVVRFLKRYSY